MKIVISVAVALLFFGCSENTNKERASQEPVKNVQKVEKPVSQVKQSAEKTVKIQKKEVVEVPAVTTEVVDKKLAVVKEASKPSVDGQKIFIACSSCHGKDASKSALGKSKVIKGWEASKVVAALKGYKAGTYGGAMKGIMKGQALKLSDAEMQAVAEYISKL